VNVRGGKRFSCIQARLGCRKASVLLLVVVNTTGCSTLTLFSSYFKSNKRKLNKVVSAFCKAPHCNGICGVKLELVPTDGIMANVGHFYVLIKRRNLTRGKRTYYFCKIKHTKLQCK
jgi:hypothetical protein